MVRTVSAGVAKRFFRTQATAPAGAARRRLGGDHLGADEGDVWSCRSYRSTSATRALYQFMIAEVSSERMR